MWEEGGSSAGGSGSNSISKFSDTSLSKHHDAVFSELMRECKHSAPGARLSARLRTSLERYLHKITRFSLKF
jgi:hypothetical protein